MAKRPTIELLLWDGATWRDVEAQQTKEGTLWLPSEQLELDAANVTSIRTGLAVLASADITLRGESDFHELRRRVILRSLFDSGSDSVKLIKNIANGCLIALCLLGITQIIGLRGDVGEIKSAESELGGAVGTLINHQQLPNPVTAVPTVQPTKAPTP